MASDMMNHNLEPEDIGISSRQLALLYQTIAEYVEAGTVPGACALIARNGQALPTRAFGKLRPGESEADVVSDTIFLVASITKPVTVAAAMMLVEQGSLLLDDPVMKYIPEFGNNGKESIRIRHLMTHTSGLPDFLPENTELRKQQAPLSEFIKRICQLTPEFEAGTAVQYQSCGLGILGAIIEVITGMSLPDYLYEKLFLPLNMLDTALGVQQLDQNRIAYVDVPEEMVDTDWGWNTAYWWNLAVPWGGMFTTTDDLYRLLQMFLDGGNANGQQILSRATVEAMTRNQLLSFGDIPRYMHFSSEWGLGWGLAGRRTEFGWAYFGDLVSPSTFGHGGATGTLAWADPERQLVCILLTTQPKALELGILARCSNIVAAAAL